MKYYHATTMSNYLGILHDKIIRPGYDHIVYMCEKPEDALKFTYIRGLKEIIVLTIDLPDDFLLKKRSTILTTSSNVRVSVLSNQFHQNT